ncbi:Hypothetical protein CGLY_00535 [Corynebacterium glyciniphilum AJ 3170]|uniref:Uncharacterized protein n=1 Tax=Corynebacterium glyciniphilum AJ 3170 TaxID=1404245 RepID=X5E502_9CORY|nr:Hypothetical protein CGLY_00535 [Corynebacterium glyciniphilum AJ 3170]
MACWIPQWAGLVINPTVASRTEVSSTRTPLRTLVVNASADKCRQVPASIESRSSANVDTWALGIPVMPRDFTRSSIRLVDTPLR